MARAHTRSLAGHSPLAGKKRFKHSPPPRSEFCSPVTLVSRYHGRLCPGASLAVALAVDSVKVGRVTGRAFFVTPQVALLQELFPSSDPIHLVEGAPMLLALSDNTLRVKSEAWRHILESSVDVPWEQVRASKSLLHFRKSWTAHQSLVCSQQTGSPLQALREGWVCPFCCCKQCLGQIPSRLFSTHAYGS